MRWSGGEAKTEHALYGGERLHRRGVSEAKQSSRPVENDATRRQGRDQEAWLRRGRGQGGASCEERISATLQAGCLAG